MKPFLKFPVLRFRYPLLALFLLCFCLPGCADESPAPPKNMKLFLLIGQSNMAGRGKVEAQDEVINPRIWMLNKENQWVLAKDPLHFDKPAIAGVGLGSEFARTIAASDPNITIGLIPSAFGGTRLDQWQPGTELYKSAIARTKIALQNGTLAGILWHQGEGDSEPDKIESYPARFKTMITQMRQDLAAPEVPAVVGELGYFRPKTPPFNAMLPELVKQVPHCGLASAEGLQHKGDKVHFDAASLRTFGKRYAAVFLKLQATP